MSAATVKGRKILAKNVARAQERVPAPVLATGVVHHKGFARRAVAFVVTLGIAFGLGGAIGGLLLAVLALGLFAGASTAIQAIGARRETSPTAADETRPAGAGKAVGFPPHAMLAVTEDRIYAFEASQRGYPIFARLSGWKLGDEIGSWNRSAVSAEAKKDVVSWKLSLTLPHAGRHALEAQAWGARGSNEAVMSLLTEQSTTRLARSADTPITEGDTTRTARRP